MMSKKIVNVITDHTNLRLIGGTEIAVRLAHRPELVEGLRRRKSKSPPRNDELSRSDGNAALLSKFSHKTQHFRPFHTPEKLLHCRPYFDILTGLF